MTEAPVTRFKLVHHQSPRVGRIALVTLDNGADHRKPNLLGEAALDSLADVLDAIERDPEVKGVLVTGKPFVFAAGADLQEFAGVDAARAHAGARRGHEVFGRLRALPVPTLAAVNGVCLGGGLELALHCDYRTLSAGARPIGFPEVFLSILPAWGGSQLTPRLVGARAALEVIVDNALNNNRTLDARKAFELGLADRLLPPVDLLDASVAMLERLVAGEERVDRRPPADDDLDETLARARQAADDRVHGATRAPYAAIDLIGHAARGGALDDGLAMEADLVAELLPARQAQAALYSFDLTQRRARRQPWRPDAPAREIRRAAVVGAGLMGAPLAALLLHRLEVPVVVRDLDESVLDQARTTVEQTLDDRVRRGRLAAPKAGFLKSIVEYTTDPAPLAGADLVVEAVAERLDVKQRVFAEVEGVVGEDCVLATNTSALSVDALASRLDHPQRVVGLHFFNPVAVMPLVEVVRGERTDDATLATAFEVAKAVRKTAVGVADAPAFVVNRVTIRFMAACGQAANHGTAFADVDDAVKALGLPMGPFELLGLVRPGVAAQVAETLHAAFPERFPVDENWSMLADSGLPGVYDWSQGRVPFDVVRERWRLAEPTRSWSPEEIRGHALEAVADEIGHILDEGVVADARDIDTCMLLGAGWPFFLGGICRYLDQTGLSEKLLGRTLTGTS